MDNSLLIGLSRQRTLLDQLNVVANNLANMNSTGYRAQRLAFNEYLMEEAEASDFRKADRVYSYVIDAMPWIDETPGTVKSSDNPLDIAIDGPGFFVLEGAQGERYTRAGAFGMDAQGRVTDRSGNPLLTDDGVLQLTPEDGAISIARDGTISTQQGVRGRLRLVTFDDPALLERVGDTMFRAPDGAARAVESPQFIQGALELSNVSGIGEITRMIDLTRRYQMVASFLKEQDQLVRRAINDLSLNPA